MIKKIAILSLCLLFASTTSAFAKHLLFIKNSTGHQIIGNVACSLGTLRDKDNKNVLDFDMGANKTMQFRLINVYSRNIMLHCKIDFYDWDLNKGAEVVIITQEYELHKIKSTNNGHTFNVFINTPQEIEGYLI